MTLYEEWVQLEYARLDLALLLRDGILTTESQADESFAAFTKRSKELWKLMHKPFKRLKRYPVKAGGMMYGRGRR